MQLKVVELDDRGLLLPERCYGTEVVDLAPEHNVGAICGGLLGSGARIDVSGG